MGNIICKRVLVKSRNTCCGRVNTYIVGSTKTILKFKKVRKVHGRDCCD